MQVQCNSLFSIAIQYDAAQCNAMQCNAMTTQMYMQMQCHATLSYLIESIPILLMLI